MTLAEYEKIINHQVKLILYEKDLKPNDLNFIELLKYKYDVALMLLCELG